MNCEIVHVREERNGKATQRERKREREREKEREKKKRNSVKKGRNRPCGVGQCAFFDDISFHPNCEKVREKNQSPNVSKYTYSKQESLIQCRYVICLCNF